MDQDPQRSPVPGEAHADERAAAQDLLPQVYDEPLVLGGRGPGCADDPQECFAVHQQPGTRGGSNGPDGLSLSLIQL